jgi:competence protein ComEC
MAHHILILPVLLGLGILAYFGLPAEPAADLGIKLTLAFAGVTLVFRRFFWTWGTLVCAIISLGFLSAQMRTDLLKTPLIHAPVFATDVKGRVHQVVFDENAYKLVLTDLSINKLEPHETPTRVRITVKQDVAMPAVGSTVRLKATLFPLPAPAAPNAFDFGRYLFFERLGAVGFSLSEPEVVAEGALPFAETIHAFRARFAQALIAEMPDGVGAVAAALTVGEQGSVSEVDVESLRASGLYHILSISGLHLALAAGIVFYVVRLMLVLLPNAALKWPIKKIAASAALVAAFFYLLVAGWPVPAQRSFVMVAVVLVAILLDRKGISMTTLAWAATFILLLLPDSLMGASFQLSFAATAAIVALYERFGHVLHATSGGVNKAVKAVVATMAVSLTATFATAPFIITYFNQLQLMGLVANVAVTPLTSFLIMPAVVVAFLLYPLGLLAWAAYPLAWGIEGMMWVARTVAALPYASIPVPSYTDWGLGLSVVGLLVLLGFRNRVAYLGMALMALAACTMAFTQEPDVLISEDAKQIAVRDAADHWVMVKGGTSSFVVDVWMKKLGQTEAVKPKNGVFDDATALTCTESDCVYACKGAKVLIMKKPKQIKARCTSEYAAAILPFKRWESECVGVAHVIDKTALRAGGAHAIYCGEHFRVENIKQFQGDRPWVP